MKAPSKLFPRKGFTLVELLVVIAIIAVLAATGFSVGPAMINKAKKTSSLATASAVAQAVEQFYTEYSALPDPGTNNSDVEFSTKESNGKKLLQILAGIDDGEQNSRKIRFLSAKEAKNGMDGIEYSADGKSIEGMFDSWGQPFFIRLDYDYDERIEFTPQKNPRVKLNGRKVAVWSLGVSDPGDASTSTLVKSW